MAQKVCIYPRVSHKDSVKTPSLDSQIKLCTERALREGWEIVEVYREEAYSGSSDERPAFQRMMEAAKRKRFDAIVVWALDRFSREKDAEKHFSLLSKSGVALISLTENFDESTPSGWFLRHIMSGAAHLEHLKISERYRRGKRDRAQLGRPNGDLCFGYYKNPQTQTIEPNPATAPGVVLAFEQYATGKFSDSEIASQLNRAGYRTSSKKGSRPFSKDTIRQMMVNRFYIGLIAYKGETFNGKHTPLVTKEIFDQCLTIRARRRLNRNNATNRAQRVYPLSHLLYCNECGLRYRAFQHPLYGDCYYHAYRALKVDCKQLVTVKGDIENDIIAVLDSLTVPADWQTIYETIKGQSPEATREADYEAARLRLEERQLRAKQLFLAGDITRAEYEQEKEAIKNKIAALEAPLQVVEKKDFQKAVTFISNIGQAYRLAQPAQKQELLRYIFEGIYISERQVRAVKPTALFYDLLCYLVRSRRDSELYELTTGMTIKITITVYALDFTPRSENLQYV